MYVGPTMPQPKFSCDVCDDPKPHGHDMIDVSTSAYGPRKYIPGMKRPITEENPDMSRIEEQPYDDRHRTEPTPPAFITPDVLRRALVTPVPAESMRDAIKTALNALLTIDLANDEEDETYAKLRGIAAGLIEVL